MNVIHAHYAKMRVEPAAASGAETAGRVRVEADAEVNK